MSHLVKVPKGELVRADRKTEQWRSALCVPVTWSQSREFRGQLLHIQEARSCAKEWPSPFLFVQPLHGARLAGLIQSITSRVETHARSQTVLRPSSLPDMQRASISYCQRIARPHKQKIVLALSCLQSTKDNRLYQALQITARLMSHGREPVRTIVRIQARAFPRISQTVATECGDRLWSNLTIVRSSLRLASPLYKARSDLIGDHFIHKH